MKIKCNKPIKTTIYSECKPVAGIEWPEDGKHQTATGQGDKISGSICNNYIFSMAAKKVVSAR